MPATGDDAMMTITFICNHLQDAIAQACQQTLAGGWLGVYRRVGGLFEVHNGIPDATHYRIIALVADGEVTFNALGGR